MTWLEALVLGIIQGLTEFLPVSSSGHLEIGNVLLGVESNDHLLFTVIVHAATALSTIVVFKDEITQLLVDLLKFKWNESWSFTIKILISMIPVAVVGLLFEDQVEAMFAGNMLLVGFALIFTSVLLFFTYFKRHTIGDVTYGNAMIIGLAQAVAIFPGVSRSGSTIATALLLGVDKVKATRFSFLMVLIPILGISLLKVKDYVEAPAAAGDISVLALIVGFIAAFVSGFVACKWMISLVRKGKLTYFAIYCFIVGTIAILSTVF